MASVTEKESEAPRLVLPTPSLLLPPLAAEGAQVRNTWCWVLVLGTGVGAGSGAVLGIGAGAGTRCRVAISWRKEP